PGAEHAGGGYGMDVVAHARRHARVQIRRAGRQVAVEHADGPGADAGAYLEKAVVGDRPGVREAPVRERHGVARLRDVDVVVAAIGAPEEPLALDVRRRSGEGRKGEQREADETTGD